MQAQAFASFHNAHRRCCKPHGTSLKYRRQARAGWCVLAWAHACCSTHPAFAVTTHTHEPPPSPEGCHRGCRAHSELQVPRLYAWGGSGRRQVGPRLKATGSWLKIPCRSAWKGGLYSKGGEPRINGSKRVCLQVKEFATRGVGDT